MLMVSPAELGFGMAQGNVSRLLKKVKKGLAVHIVCTCSMIGGHSKQTVKIHVGSAASLAQAEACSLCLMEESACVLLI